MKKNHKNKEDDCEKVVYPLWFRTLVFGINTTLITFLKGTGLWATGLKNALDLKVNKTDLYLPDLPKSFDGFRILFMSDFHFGKIKELPEIVFNKVGDIEADLCLLGGDYRSGFSGSSAPVLSIMKELAGKIRAPHGIFGVLGNHDHRDMVAGFEKTGIRILLNESIIIEKQNQKLFVIGVEDPHFHKRHDLQKAFDSVPAGAFKVFLAHCPELYAKAEERGADVYLCGHTHNGQIRLPWLGAPMSGCLKANGFIGGLWKYKSMTGYTSSGVGVSMVHSRFYCPPEISVLTLRSATDDQINHSKRKTHKCLTK